MLLAARIPNGLDFSHTLRFFDVFLSIFLVCTDQIIMETNKDLQMTGLQDKYNRLSIEEMTETTEMSEEGAVSAEEVRLLLFSIPFFLV